ncbi:MAG: response regulator transcription factor [Clostridiales Family XIII bacterium]|nr:response regulator transcription factor [Clostridiales Family XIII bacterium]
MSNGIDGNLDRVRVLIADDDSIIRQGLSMIISSDEGMELVGIAPDGEVAAALCRKSLVDVAVLDIRMPVLDGIEAASLMLSEGTALPLLLTTFDEPELIARALRCGARGYILKNSPPETILSAIVTVARGGTVFAQDVIDYIRGAVEKGTIAILPEDSAYNFFSELTPRELEIVALVSEGLSNAQIAENLFLADGTVRNHISTIMEKTGLEHRTQIAVRYLTMSNS